MKLLRFALGLALLAPLGAQGPGPLYKFNGTADFGYGSWMMPGDLCAYVTITYQAARAGTPAMAYLFYAAGPCSGEPTELGEGYISPSDVMPGSGHRALMVSTDTSAEANPSFMRYLGNGGRIEVTLQAAGEWQDRITGTERYKFGTEYLYHRSGTQETWSAKAEGTILGQLFGGGWGAVGTAHEMVIAIMRGK